MSHELFMRKALEEAAFAAEEGEIPVGVLITCKGKIIARAHNQTERLQDVTAHAEMIAITMATAALGGKYLNECTLYVTLEPCSMCKEVIRKSRIKNTYYFINQNEHITEKEPNFIKIEDKINFSNKLTQFFKNKR